MASQAAQFCQVSTVCVQIVTFIVCSNLERFSEWWLRLMSVFLLNIQTPVWKHFSNVLVTIIFQYVSRVPETDEILLGEKSSIKNFSLSSHEVICNRKQCLPIECPSILIEGMATSSAFSNAYLHRDHFIHQCQSHNCRMKHGNYLQYRIVLLINLRQEIKTRKMQPRARQIKMTQVAMTQFRNWSECTVATSYVLKRFSETFYP